MKQRISRQFKTEPETQNFAKIRSLVNTTIKSRMNVLGALTLIAKLEINPIN